MTYSNGWNKTLRQQTKTTPRFDPDASTKERRRRDSRRKPSVSYIKTHSLATIEDGCRVWRVTWHDGKTYEVRHKMTQDELDAEVLRKWHEAAGRAPQMLYIDDAVLSSLTNTVAI